MNLLTLIFILATTNSGNNVTTYSDRTIIVTPHPLCTKPKGIHYSVDGAIFCIGSSTVDTIFKGGFE